MDLVTIRMQLTGGKQVAAEAKTASAAIAETGAATKAAGTAGASGMARLAKSTATLKKAGRAMSMYVTAPAIAIGVASGKMALDFDRSMRNVNSIAGLPEKKFKALKQQVLDMAGPTAQAPQTLSEGLYDLVSSGFDAAESVTILKSSALAASAGLTTTDISTKAVAASLNAYRLPAEQAAFVSDVLFKTVDRGVVSFPELASTIGDVLPFASQLKVDLPQVGAAIATMTKQGLSGAEAATRYKNALITMIKPGKDLNKALDELGVSGAKLVERKGMQGAMEALISTTDGSQEAIGKLFPNIRALGAVLSLTGDNAAGANEDLRGFADAAGATATVLKEQEKSFGFKLQRAWSELSVVLIELGDKLLPIVVPMLLDLANAVRDAVDWFSALPKPLQKVAGAVGGITLLAGPMMLFAAAVLTAATNLGILRATEAGGIGLNKGRLGRMGVGALGVGAIAAGQSGVGGSLGAAAGNIGGGAMMGFAAGGPWGAAIGGGIGAAVTLAPIVADLLSSGPKVSKLAQELTAQTDRAAQAQRGFRESLQGLPRAQQRVVRSQDAHQEAARRARKASAALGRTLGRFGPESLPATEAQLKLSRANERVVRTARRVRNAQRLQGNELHLFRLKTREVVASEKARIPNLKAMAKRLNEQISKGKGTTQVLERTVNVEKQLSTAKRRLTTAYAEAESKGSKPFARQLQRMNTLQAEYGSKGKTLVTRMNEQRDKLKILKDAGYENTDMWKEQNRELRETVRLYDKLNALSGVGLPPLLPQPGAAPQTATPKKRGKTPNPQAGNFDKLMSGSGGQRQPLHATLVMPDGRVLAELSAEATANERARA